MLQLVTQDNTGIVVLYNKISNAMMHVWPVKSAIRSNVNQDRWDKPLALFVTKLRLEKKWSQVDLASGLGTRHGWVRSWKEVTLVQPRINRLSRRCF